MKNLTKSLANLVAAKLLADKNMLKESESLLKSDDYDDNGISIPEHPAIASALRNYNPNRIRAHTLPHEEYDMPSEAHHTYEVSDAHQALPRIIGSLTNEGYRLREASGHKNGVSVHMEHPETGDTQCIHLSHNPGLATPPAPRDTLRGGSLEGGEMADYGGNR